MLVELESCDPSTRLHFTTVGKGLPMDIMNAVYNSSTCLQLSPSSRHPRQCSLFLAGQLTVLSLYTDILQVGLIELRASQAVLCRSLAKLFFTSKCSYIIFIPIPPMQIGGGGLLIINQLQQSLWSTNQNSDHIYTHQPFVGPLCHLPLTATCNPMPSQTILLSQTRIFSFFFIQFCLFRLTFCLLLCFLQSFSLFPLLLR